MAKFSATQLDIFFAVVLFLAGLGYSVSGFPASVLVACIIWGTAWLFLLHLFFIYDGTASCPTDVKIVIWGAVTFMLVLVLLDPVRRQYAKEHTRFNPARENPVTSVASAPAKRSYVVFDGNMRFAEKRDDKGQLIADQNFQIGDELLLNFYFKATGPNPVDVTETARWLYIEPDYAVQTQREMIADFKRKLSRERKTHQAAEESTFMPEERRFGTAYAKAAKNQHRIVTQDDLNALRTGTEVAFVIVQITYNDNEKVHHLRMCQWLQPPASSPGIWHFCEGFTKSA